jgi:hypothetical protein
VRTFPLLLLVAATRAFADPCGDPRFDGPPEIGVREGDLGAPRLPCAEKSVYLHLRGYALLDIPDFYGTLDASALVGVRVPVRDVVELSASLRLVDYRFVQNASVIADELGAGPLAIGALLPLRAGAWAIAPSVRWFVPGTDWPAAATALEGGFAAATEPRRWLSVYANAALYGWMSYPATHGALALSGGAAWTPKKWFAFALGLEAQAGWYGVGLDHLLARGGLRFRTKAGDFALDAIVPFAGRERTTAVAQIDWQLFL